MLKLFKPGMYLLDRLTYSKKFAFLGVFLLLCIVAAMTLLITELNHSIKSNEKEIVGVEQIIPIRALMENIQSYRSAADTALEGGAPNKGQLAALASGIDQSIQKVDAVYRTSGKDTNSEEKWIGLKDDWKAFKGKENGLTPLEKFEQLTAMLNKSTGLVSDVGDASNLILDPSYDSYYLMDAVINHLPLMTEAIAQSQSLIQRGKVKESLTLEERKALLTYSVQMNVAMDALKKGMAGAFKSNPGINPALDTSLNKLAASTAGYYEAINDAVVTSVNVAKLNASYDLAASSMNAAYQVYDLSLPELRAIIQERVDDYKNRMFWVTAGTLLGVIVALYLFISFIYETRGVIEKLKVSSQLMANGDLTARVELSGRDEMQQVAMSINQVAESFGQMITEIYQTAMKLDHSSNDLIKISDHMTVYCGEIDNMNRKTGIVSDAVEQITRRISETAEGAAHINENIKGIFAAIEGMSTNMGTLAAASEQVSTSSEEIARTVTQISGSIQTVSRSSSDVSNSVNNVAASIKEIDMSLNEVSHNCERSLHITDNAERRAIETKNIIEKLNRSSKQIGKIVNVIHEIAEQTNMLALNAAIEAAGAGEAGKGFAVVANEVKELAKQTAEATDEISQQIEDMQQNMGDAVQAVDTIADVVIEITSISNNIAAAVTQQSSAANEISAAVAAAAAEVNLISREISDIAANSLQVSVVVSESSSGIQEMAVSTSTLSFTAADVVGKTEAASEQINLIARSSSEISQKAVEIASNVREIVQTSADSFTGAEETAKTAKELAEMAKQMGTWVQQFKI
ncbi:methyl-accepting chemotaxis protein [Paenibacillus hamazuiensis]|uniref:methyl-accepting chemotaxis protein n=1 Tax=Paenibacillus hamazuiensis TaxID=2936508 RepID=UPI00200C56C6|nr:methyl-accepting chemotaxis protein [Paenibacillus hamazuiensis]